MKQSPSRITRPTRARLVSMAYPIAASALLAMVGAGCSSSPKLTDRERSAQPGESGSNDAAEAIAKLMRDREEARRLAARAEAAENDDRDEQAIDLYRAALGLDDSLQHAWNNLGSLLMERGVYADAVAAFQRASQLVPGDPRPEYNIGVAYQRNGWGEDALRHFGYAIDRDASHLPSIRGFVRASEMTGKADLALLEVIKGATLRETDPAWRAYFQRQRYRVEAVIDER